MKILQKKPQGIHYVILDGRIVVEDRTIKEHAGRFIERGERSWTESIKY